MSEPDHGLPTVLGLPFWLSCCIYVIGFANVLSIMIFSMDMQKLIKSIREEVRLKHLFLVFVFPGFLLAWVCIGVYYFFRSNMLKRIWNFRVYPRPEWVPILRVIGKLLLLAFIIWFCT